MNPDLIAQLAEQVDEAAAQAALTMLTADHPSLDIETAHTVHAPASRV